MEDELNCYDFLRKIELSGKEEKKYVVIPYGRRSYGGERKQKKKIIKSILSFLKYKFKGIFIYLLILVCYELMMINMSWT